MSSTSTCDNPNCSNTGARRILRWAPEGWFYFITEDNTDPDGGTVIQVCSESCRDSIPWEPGPGRIPAGGLCREPQSHAGHPGPWRALKTAAHDAELIVHRMKEEHLNERVSSREFLMALGHHIEGAWDAIEDEMGLVYIHEDRDRPTARPRLALRRVVKHGEVSIKLVAKKGDVWLEVYRGEGEFVSEPVRFTDVRLFVSRAVHRLMAVIEGKASGSADRAARHVELLGRLTRDLTA